MSQRMSDDRVFGPVYGTFQAGPPPRTEPCPAEPLTSTETAPQQPTRRTLRQRLITRRQRRRNTRP